MKRFIIVGKSKYIVLAVLQALRSFSDQEAIVIGDDETDAMRWSSLCSQKLPLRFDGNSDGAFVRMVRRLADDVDKVHLLPVDCDGIRLVNRVKHQFQNQPRIVVSPIPAPDILETFDDKWLFHQFCVQHGLRVPDTRFVGRKDNLDFDQLVKEFSLPFVVKPTNLAGSIGVEVIGSSEEFDTRIRSNPAYPGGSLIVQRYIDGPDIDLSLLAHHGMLRACAIQRLNGHRIEFLPNAYLEMVASQICRDSGFHGLMHIDARMDARTGTMYLIEANPRFWASLTACVVSGLNFVAEAIAPAAASTGVKQLISGGASSRHPMLQPSSWKSLATDGGYLGRLLRAKALDPYSVGQFGIALSESCMRYARKKAVWRGAGRLPSAFLLQDLSGHQDRTSEKRSS